MSKKHLFVVTLIFLLKRNYLLSSKVIDMVDCASKEYVSSVFFSLAASWTPLWRFRMLLFPVKQSSNGCMCLAILITHSKLQEVEPKKLSED